MGEYDLMIQVVVAVFVRSYRMTTLLVVVVVVVRGRIFDKRVVTTSCGVPHSGRSCAPL